MNNTKKVKEVIAKIDDLPTLPTVVTKLMELVDNPNSNAKDINDVIKTDQALTTKVLKLVNSAYYAFPRAIATVTDAVVILGFNTVRSLALSVTVCKMFSGGDEDFSREDLWEHSIAVAFASRIIAKMVGFKNEEQAFVAGLLHDVAKIIEDQNIHEEFIKAVIESREKKISLIETEKKYIGMDHSLIGRRVADKWELPHDITKVIGYHHRPEFAGDAEHKKLASIVHVADAIVKIRKIGHSGNYGKVSLDQNAVSLLKLAKKDLAKVVQGLIKEMKNASAFLEIIKG
ncbi:MAG: HDOD domain-containing protein [Fusobacteriota bacterium]